MKQSTVWEGQCELGEINLDGLQFLREILEMAVKKKYLCKRIGCFF